MTGPCAGTEPFPTRNGELPGDRGRDGDPDVRPAPPARLRDDVRAGRTPERHTAMVCVALRTSAAHSRRARVRGPACHFRTPRGPIRSGRV